MDKKILAVILVVAGLLSFLLGPIMWNFSIGLGYSFLAIGLILLVAAAAIALKKN